MALSELQAAFRHRHPEAGDIRAGTLIGSEQLWQWSEIIGAKVMALSEKTTLSREETSFIDRTMDLGVRSVIYAHERLGLPLPESENTVLVAEGIAQLQGAAPAPQDILAGLHSLTGSAYSVRANPAFRASLQNIGRGSVGMLADMATTGGGLAIDAYLEGNLQNVSAHYEQIGQ